MIRSTIKRGLEKILGIAPQQPPRPAPGAAPSSPPSEPVPRPATGEPLNAEAVRDVIEEMVRPALQADGGDISLVKIDGADVHVRLAGACSSCPSATMTMTMGVEALLREEFPQMGELVRVP